jgi:Protein of unknown function (DUF4054)
VTSLELYRILVPAHSAVLEDTINVWLELAAKRHNYADWGPIYAEAMVLWAAHGIETSPGSGGGSGGAGVVGPIISQKDGDLSRTYAYSSSSGGSSADSRLATTTYGQMYLDLRNSRAAIGPMFVLP